jgi:hypothetical protein
MVQSSHIFDSAPARAGCAIMTASHHAERRGQAFWKKGKKIFPVSCETENIILPVLDAKSGRMVFRPICL